MPERPELEYVVSVLQAEIRGLTITELLVQDPIVLRVLVEGDPRQLLAGRILEGVGRRAHFVVLSLAGAPELEVAIHPMLAGRFTLVPGKAKITKDTKLSFALSDGRHLRYRDAQRMGKVYLLPPSLRDKAPGLATIGVDVLDPAAFTPEAFARILATRRDQLKVFLMDKTALDAMGNAYADEVAFAAGIHPKAWVRSLDEEQRDRLYHALIEVLGGARAEIARRQPPLDQKVRDFLKVRLRKGEPCPTCGAPIRVAGVRGHDAFFCASCQPDDRGSGLIDWRR